ncbi:MAG: DUF3137 domain-containing protein [Nitrospinales bacterium]
MTKPKHTPFEERFKHEEGFAQYYETNVVPEIIKLEKRRRKLESPGKNMYWVTGIFWFAGISGLAASGASTVIWGVSLSLLGFLTYLLLSGYGSNFDAYCKKKFIPLLLKFYGDFVYKPEGGMSLKTLANFEIFPSYQEVGAADYIKGTYKEVEVEMEELLLTSISLTAPIAEVAATAVASTILDPLDNNSSSVWDAVETEKFRKKVFLLSVPKNYLGRTVIKQDHAKYSSLLSNIQNDFERVYFEYPEFEDLFQVYSTNQIEARNLLTTGFIERVMDLDRLFKEREIELEFFQNKLIIIVNNNDSSETPTYDCMLQNTDTVRIILGEIGMILSIVDVLKFDQKIGL